MKGERSDRDHYYGPAYRLRVVAPRKREWRLEIWQAPSPATPRLEEPEHVATLKGTPLRMMEPRLVKNLNRARINLGNPQQAKTRTWALEEELAMSLGLLFRVLAPMKNLDRIREVADGVEGMSREEAGYWLGMSMHRKNPRRVLAALRTMLTSPAGS